MNAEPLRGHEGAFPMLAALTTFLAGSRPPAAVRPILLRVTDDRSRRSIELAVAWHVAGAAIPARVRLQVSDGMCLLPWRAQAAGVSIDAPDGEVEIARDGYGGEVVELV